jgi:hypothetical protein
MMHLRLICFLYALLLLIPGVLRAGNWTSRTDLLPTPPVQGEVYAEFAPDGSLLMLIVDAVGQVWAFNQETPGAPPTQVNFTAITIDGAVVLLPSLSGGSDVEVEILRSEASNSLAVIISWLDPLNPLVRIYRFLLGEKRFGGPFGLNAVALNLPAGASEPKFNYTFGQLVMAARFADLGSVLRMYRFDPFSLAWTELASLTGDYRPLGFGAGYGSGAFIAYLLLKNLADGRAYVYALDIIASTLSLVGGGAASEGGIGEEGSIRARYDFALARMEIAILFSDLGAGGKASVRRLAAGGNAWEYLGLRGFSAGGIACLSLLIAEGFFYASFRDAGSGNLLQVLQIGAAGVVPWTSLLGTSLVTACQYSLRASSLARSEPYLYLFFQDANTGVASVLQYDPSAASAIEDAAQMGLRLGPVPARDHLHLRSEAGLPIRSLALSDLQGRLLWQEELPSPQMERSIPLGDLPAGLYFLRVNGAASLRFSKQE